MVLPSSLQRKDIYIFDWGRAECDASLGDGKYMNYAQPSYQDLVYLFGERKLRIVEYKLRSESGSESCRGNIVFCKIVAILGHNKAVPPHPYPTLPSIAPIFYIFDNTTIESWGLPVIIHA